jgi:hypothetical protein
MPRLEIDDRQYKLSVFSFPNKVDASEESQQTQEFLNVLLSNAFPPSLSDSWQKNT